MSRLGCSHPRGERRERKSRALENGASILLRGGRENGRGTKRRKHGRWPWDYAASLVSDLEMESSLATAAALLRQLVHTINNGV
jgi:hypothetical protein